MKPDERKVRVMTGYDIRNAMNKAFGISGTSDSSDLEIFDASEGMSRIQRLFVAMMFAMKGRT
jgi:hypothetical protein